MWSFYPALFCLFCARTLYQQQNQPMDALQAYVCAVQLDKTHSPAWFDLGMLYESLKQFSDALHCYQNGIKHGKTAATPSIIQRAELLETSIKSCAAAFESVYVFPIFFIHKLLPFFLRCKILFGWKNLTFQTGFSFRTKTLPSLEEALALPIAAELTAGHRQPQTVKKTSLLPESADSLTLNTQQLQLLQALRQQEVRHVDNFDEIWLIDSISFRLIDWLIDWLMDVVSVGLIDWCSDWLIDWLENLHFTSIHRGARWTTVSVGFSGSTGSNASNITGNAQRPVFSATRTAKQLRFVQ